MWSFTRCIFLVGYFLWKADAEVTLMTENTIDEDGGMACGSTVTLVCTISPYNGTMTWKVDDITAMECTAGQCRTVPPYHPNYGFTFNPSEGVFNLKVTGVQFKDNGRSFACSDETTSASLVAAVKVLPDEATTEMVAVNTTNNTEITVTTGCVYPADNLDIKWFYFKEGEDPEPFTEMEANNVLLDPSLTECGSGDCGGEGVTKMTSALMFEEDTSEDGEEYYLQAVVTSSDFEQTVVVKSEIAYKLKFSDSLATVLESGAQSMGLIIALSVVGVIILITVIAIAIVCLRAGKDPEKERIMPN